MAARLVIAMLVVLGIAALGEIGKSIGQRYFHIYGPDNVQPG